MIGHNSRWVTDWTCNLIETSLLLDSADPRKCLISFTMRLPAEFLSSWVRIKYHLICHRDTQLCHYIIQTAAHHWRWQGCRWMLSPQVQFSHIIFHLHILHPVGGLVGCCPLVCALHRHWHCYATFEIRIFRKQNLPLFSSLVHLPSLPVRMHFHSRFFWDKIAYHVHSITTTTTAMSYTCFRTEYVYVSRWAGVVWRDIVFNISSTPSQPPTPKRDVIEWEKVSMIW